MRFGKLSRKNSNQDTYYCRVTKPNGNRTWKSTGTNKFDEACRVKRNWERNEALCPTCEEGGLFKRIDEFLASKKHKSPEYKRVLNVYAKSWREFFGDCRLDEITPKLIEAYLDRDRRARNKQPAQRTINNERGYLSIFFKWAMVRQYCRWNPALCVEKRPETKKKVRALSDEEVRRLLLAAEECDEQSWTFVRIAIDTGLRKGTIAKLTWCMLQDGYLTVPAELMKSRQEFRVPLKPTLARWLEKTEGILYPNSYVCGPMPAPLWKHITKVAGLPDITIHDLRRTFITRLRRANVPLEVAMALSDHRDIKTVLESYRAVEDEDMRKALEQL
jgi:integrase